MLISTGCARQAYRSDVTNDPLVSHQVVGGQFPKKSLG